MKDIPDIQDIHQRAAQTPRPRQLTRQLQILLRRKAPQKDDRNDAHLHASHKRRGADRKVKDGHVLRAMEPVLFRKDLEDGRLRERDADDAFERRDLVDDLMLFQLGRHAAGEPDDAEDADGGGDGFDDAEGGGFL